MNRRSPSLLLISVVLAIAVFLAFSPSLTAGFLNWDDDVNILENPAVRSLDISNLKQIFTQSVQKIYIPLTTLSYAIEYHFVGYKPFLYHLDNIILHILNTLLVFAIALRLGLPTTGAIAAALLFGIHPMKVESVAWVTERKDVLYAFFYLLAMLAYIVDLQRRGNSPACRQAGRCAPTRFYYASIILGTLSLLAKPMALSLPLILLLMDWFNGRTVNRRAILEKVPFFLYVIPITWITYAQHVRNPISDLTQAVLIWAWSFAFYIWKFLAPFVLLPMYQLPQPVSIFQPPFFLSVGAFVLLIASVFLFRRNRWWLLAVGYYVLSIFFLLRFDVGVDLNIVADRFMYLPCLGFCLAAGYLLNRLAEGKNYWRIYGIAGAVIVVLMMKTFAQSQIWTTPMTLWNYVIDKDPKAHIAYNNRGNIYNEGDQLNEAMADYNKALEMDPKFARALNNRGVVYAKAGRDAQALADFNKAIEFKPGFEKAYYNRAVVQERLGQYSAAFKDVRKSKELGAPVPEDFYLKLEKLNSPQ